IGLGDAPVTLTATGNLAVEAVFNPTQLTLSYRQFSSNPIAADAIANSVLGSDHSVDNYYSTFGKQSAVAFTSIAGDVGLLMNMDLKQPLLNESKSPTTARTPGLNILPSKLDVASVQGDINLNGSIILAPEKDGRLNLTAQGNIVANSELAGNSGKEIAVQQLDLLPEDFGSIDQPIADFSIKSDTAFTRLWGTSDKPGLTEITSKNAHSAKSVYLGDTVNNWIYSASGDIARSPDMATSRFIIVSAKGMDINANGNLRDTSVIFHHQDASQHSSITTGRDMLFTEARDTSNKLKDDNGNGILVLGSGSLRVQAGGSINLNTSEGIQSLGQGEVETSRTLTQYNPYLADKAADLFISAGINKTPNYGAVITQYLAKPRMQGKTFVDLIGEATPEQFISQLNLQLSQPVKTLDDARSQFARLPLWRQQQVALGATRFTNTAAEPNYSRELVAYVTSPSFNKLDLQNALNTELGSKFEGSQAVQNALAALPIEQQHNIALKALGDGGSVLARNFLDGLVLSEIRQGGETAIRQGLKKVDPEGYERGYAALATLYPGIAKDNNPWAGSLAMDNTKIRTSAEADVNILLPGGNFEVGLETPTLAQDTIASKGIGLVVGSYGDINVAAAGSINVNKSRIFNLGGGDVMLWSSYGDVDAGKGAKTALSVPPPKVQIDPNTGA
ncbi:MAG TPA: filamentous hemagglutinin family protein, partial [Cellvibrionaceae bacterium]|nr:filamentous hemagglutinin family protein [Cellvibrionaceae bacterium]